MSKVKKTEEVAVVESHKFDPKKLMGSGAGLWKYAEDPEKVSREVFQQNIAKNYGIKPGDVVIVSQDGKVNTIGV